MRLGKRERQARRETLGLQRAKSRRERVPELGYVTNWQRMFPHGKPSMPWGWDYREHLKARRSRARIIEG